MLSRLSEALLREILVREILHLGRTASVCKKLAHVVKELQGRFQESLRLVKTVGVLIEEDICVSLSKTVEEEGDTLDVIFALHTSALQLEWFLQNMSLEKLRFVVSRSDHLPCFLSMLASVQKRLLQRLHIHVTFLQGGPPYLSEDMLLRSIARFVSNSPALVDFAYSCDCGHSALANADSLLRALPSQLTALRLNRRLGNARSPEHLVHSLQRFRGLTHLDIALNRRESATFLYIVRNLHLQPLEYMKFGFHLDSSNDPIDPGIVELLCGPGGDIDVFLHTAPETLRRFEMQPKPYVGPHLPHLLDPYSAIDTIARVGHVEIAETSHAFW